VGGPPFCVIRVSNITGRQRVSDVDTEKLWERTCSRGTTLKKSNKYSYIKTSFYIRRPQMAKMVDNFTSFLPSNVRCETIMHKNDLLWPTQCGERIAVDFPKLVRQLRQGQGRLLVCGKVP